MRETHKKVCEECKGEFNSVRSDAKYCCTGCRVLASTNRIAISEATPAIKEAAKNETILMLEEMKLKRYEDLVERANKETGLDFSVLSDDFVKRSPTIDQKINALQYALRDFHLKKKIFDMISSGATEISTDFLPTNELMWGASELYFREDGIRLIRSKDKTKFFVEKT